MVCILVGDDHQLPQDTITVGLRDHMVGTQIPDEIGPGCARHCGYRVSGSFGQLDGVRLDSP